MAAGTGKTRTVIGMIYRFNKRAKKEDENYILLGDFNIFNTGDATMKALEKQGFYIPDAMKEHPTDLGQVRYYDQIAFKLKNDPNITVFSEGKQHAGAFDFPVPRKYRKYENMTMLTPEQPTTALFRRPVKGIHAFSAALFPNDTQD